MKISMIVAMSKNRVIGKDNDIPWRITGEQKRFRELTTGKTIIMGRKTYESIGKPLPNRRNIIISRDSSYFASGCETATSLEASLNLSKNEEEVFIIGGEAIYRAALPLTNRIYLTIIDLVTEGDTFFPEIDETFQEIESTFIENKPSYIYKTFERN